MLELHYDFVDKYYDVTKFKELQMDTDSFYLTLSEHDLYDCIRPAMKKVWNSLRSGDCTGEFSANSTTSFLHRTCWAKYKKHERREPGLIKEEVRCTEMICFCRKTYFCNESLSNDFKFSSRGLKKECLNTDDSPMFKHRKVSEDVKIVTNKKSISHSTTCCCHIWANKEEIIIPLS